MIPAMAEIPEEPASPVTDETDLDPEDAPVVLDEDGFLVSGVGGRHLQFPIDLDVWLPWAGPVVVGVAAFETLSDLISGSLLGWENPGSYTLPPPDGYFSLLLLAGVILLVLLRRAGAGTAAPRWVRGAACLAAGTGGALVVAQLIGNVGLIIHPDGEALGQPAAYTAGAIVSFIGDLADAVISALAAVLAVLLYRWSRAGVIDAIEDTGEREPAGVRDGEAAASDGAVGDGTTVAPDWRPRVSVGPAVASLLLGAAVAGTCLVVFVVGQSRNQVVSQTELVPVTTSPAVPVPSGVMYITCTGSAPCTGSAGSLIEGGGTAVPSSGVTTPSPAPAPAQRRATRPTASRRLRSRPRRRRRRPHPEPDRDPGRGSAMMGGS
jgi:hypothetical protein